MAILGRASILVAVMEVMTMVMTTITLMNLMTVMRGMTVDSLGRGLFSQRLIFKYIFF